MQAGQGGYDGDIQRGLYSLIQAGVLHLKGSAADYDAVPTVLLGELGNPLEHEVELAFELVEGAGGEFETGKVHLDTRGEEGAKGVEMGTGS